MKRAATDWEQVRRRLRVSTAAIEGALAESPERIEAAYRSRAASLAKTELAQPVSAGVPALVFGLAQERYAIELQELTEVLPFARCIKVPGAPPLFRGVMNVRGELRSVVDLGRLIGSLRSSADPPTASGAGESGFVLMLRRPGREIGLQVDRIEELREFRPEELDAPGQANYAKGVHAGAMIIVLAVDAVLEKVFTQQEHRTI